jgi:hypothetical protein
VAAAGAFVVGLLERRERRRGLFSRFLVEVIGWSEASDGRRFHSVEIILGHRLVTHDPV